MNVDTMIKAPRPLFEGNATYFIPSDADPVALVNHACCFMAVATGINEVLEEACSSEAEGICDNLRLIASLLYGQKYMLEMVQQLFLAEVAVSKEEQP